MSKPILSARAQTSLHNLQRTLQHEMRVLMEHHTRLLGAMQACDAQTQYAELREFVQRVDAVVTASTRLQSFLDRNGAARGEEPVTS